MEAGGVRLLAIDPGPVESALLLYDTEARAPLSWSKQPNPEAADIVTATPLDADLLAVEMIASYGMAVGAEVFETCVWAGRFIERWLTPTPLGAIVGGKSYPRRPEPIRVYRRECKLHLCGTQRAKDTNIRQALVDRYGPGKDKAVGRKASPGPLYGMKADVWQALAVAITAAETRLESLEAAA